MIDGGIPRAWRVGEDTMLDEATARDARPESIHVDPLFGMAVEPAVPDVVEAYEEPVRILNPAWVRSSRPDVRESAAGLGRVAALALRLSRPPERPERPEPARTLPEVVAPSERRIVTRPERFRFSVREHLLTTLGGWMDLVGMPSGLREHIATTPDAWCWLKGCNLPGYVRVYERPAQTAGHPDKASGVRPGAFSGASDTGTGVTGKNGLHGQSGRFSGVTRPPGSCRAPSRVWCTCTALTCPARELQALSPSRGALALYMLDYDNMMARCRLPVVRDGRILEQATMLMSMELMAYTRVVMQLAALLALPGVGSSAGSFPPAPDFADIPGEGAFSPEDEMLGAFLWSLFRDGTPVQDVDLP